VTGLLLDTHTFVWAVADPKRLSRRAKALVEDRTNELFVSAGSAWELSTKVSLGRFDEAEPLVGDFEHFVADLGASLLDISARHALRAGALRWAHRDPFDRMLAAQAMSDHLDLVTKDPAFAELAGLTTRW
jgi:PIN domain nuclease of toxin-antitoxin system